MTLVVGKMDRRGKEAKGNGYIEVLTSGVTVVVRLGLGGRSPYHRTRCMRDQ